MSKSDICVYYVSHAVFAKRLQFRAFFICVLCNGEQILCGYSVLTPEKPTFYNI